MHLDGFELSTDRSRLDLDRVEVFLRASYWAAERPRDVIARTFEHSLCLGLYRIEDGLQVAFCRAVTDYSTFAWIADVLVDPDLRGLGLGKHMVQSLVGLPELAGVRLVLQTNDAHSLYAHFGFHPLSHTERWMERAP
jgi:GNAT superfamily N-acetyltransferase